jgi:hypothetical protein
MMEAILGGLSVRNGSESTKIEVFWARYLKVAALAEPDPGDSVCLGQLEVTLADLARIWDCSLRAAQETLRRLEALNLLQWLPSPGRGHRSRLTIRVHPVWIYEARAERAEAGERWAEAAFWYRLILENCPCVPGAAEHLEACYGQLGLVRTAPPIYLNSSCCAS